MIARKSSSADSHMDAGSFIPRHIGPSEAEQREIVAVHQLQEQRFLAVAEIPRHGGQHRGRDVREQALSGAAEREVIGIRERRVRQRRLVHVEFGDLLAVRHRGASQEQGIDEAEDGDVDADA